MRAPAFTCRCIQQAEKIDAEQWFCADEGNHFEDFWVAWYHDGKTSRTRVKDFAQLREHYEAHALGAPHSHIEPREGRAIGLRCDCHDWNQTIGGDGGIRGIRWVEVPLPRCRWEEAERAATP